MASEAIVTGIVDYYKNLLIVQYHNKEKAQATIDAVITECVANGVAFDVRDGFSVDTAIGAQLDIIGKYVGIDRFYNSIDITGIHFGYSDAFSNEPDGTTGYADAADFLTKEGSFLSTTDLVGNGFSLSDADFRTLIKLKILLNNSNFSNKQLDDSLETIFSGDLYYIDNLNMSLEYFVNTNMALITQVALDKGLLPKPMGVRINNIIQNEIYFGYSDNNSLEPLDVTGYATASDFLTKAGQFLGVDNFL